MSNGDIPVVDLDPYLLAVQATLFALQQAGLIPDLNPLDYIISAFDGKPKLEDTELAALRLQASPWWPLQALGNNLQIWVRNGVPLSTGDVQLRQQLSQWIHGTMDSIEPIVFNRFDPASLNHAIWLAMTSQFGDQAIRQLNSEIANQQAQGPLPALPTTPQGGSGGSGSGGGGGFTSDGDELGDLGQTLSNDADQIIALLKAMAQGSGQANQDCCTNIVNAIGAIVTELTAIATCVCRPETPPAPIDLAPIVNEMAALVNAIGGLNTGSTIDITPLVNAVNNLSATLAGAPAVDVQGIIDQLKQANQQGIIPAAFIDALVARGVIAPELGQLFSDRPWPEGFAAMFGGFFGGEAADIVSGQSGFINAILSGMRPIWNKFLAFINEYEPKIAAAAASFVHDHAATLEKIANGLLTAGEALPVAGAGTIFDWAFRQLRKGGNITPDNVEDRALQFYGLAWLIGQGVHLLSELAGYLKYPASSVWAKNAELLIDLLKFEPLVHALHGAFFPVAIGQPAQYRFNREFRPHLPTAGQAAELYSRRKITHAELDTLYAYNGFNQRWVNHLVSISYRPLSPFMLAAGFANADIDMAVLQGALEYMGIRPEDLPLAEQAIVTRSLQQTRQALVHKAISAYGQGVVDDAELQQILTDAGYGKTASKLVMQDALLERRMTLAKETESFVVPEITQGLLTHAQGVQALEAAGIQPWQADLKAQLADTRAALTAARKAAEAAHKLALQRQRNLTRAAIAEYERGALDDAGLTAALIALGLDPTLIATIVAVESAKRAGRLRLVYGQLLDPTAARILAEKVAALETQFKKQLIDQASTRAQLAALKLDPAEIEALIARWAAARSGATKTGYQLPV